MNLKKIILYSLIGFVLSGVFFGTILYFTVFRTSGDDVVDTYYEFELGSFSTNLSHPRNFFKGDIVVETTNRNLLGKFEEKNAELRDQIIKTLLNKEPDEILSPEGQQQLRQEILQTISEVMGSDKITNVYFTDYIIQ